MAELVKKKPFKIGASYAITLPMAWLRWIEKNVNLKPEELVFELEVKENEIRVRIAEEVLKRGERAVMATA